MKREQKDERKAIARWILNEALAVPVERAWVELGLGEGDKDYMIAGGLFPAPWRPGDPARCVRIGPMNALLLAGSGRSNQRMNKRNTVRDYLTGEEFDVIEVVQKVRRCSCLEAVRFLMGDVNCEIQPERPE
jgi:hypothetical protein